MGPLPISQNPFAVLTFIVAPAILTNASSVLAMSTINRMLRTRERMHELYAEFEDASRKHGPDFMQQVNRVEKQAMLLLSAMRWIYTSLGSFAAAVLVSLLGAVAGELNSEFLMRVVVGMGLLFGVVGVSGIVGGTIYLFHATQLSLENIKQEAKLIRAPREMGAE